MSKAISKSFRPIVRVGFHLLLKVSQSLFQMQPDTVEIDLSCQLFCFAKVQNDSFNKKTRLFPKFELE